MWWQYLGVCVGVLSLIALISKVAYETGYRAGFDNARWEKQ